jgi:spore maturation protein CgeB
MRIVILGLSITSSWGNGHATTYRGLVRGLEQLGHRVLFLERDVPWYRDNRDLAQPTWGRTELYDSPADLDLRFRAEVAEADAVIVGSYVPDGVAIGEWVLRTAHGVTAFYDIDTPITLAALARDECPYLSAGLVPRYGVYLSFTGGPTLELLERRYGSPMARPLYCSVDPRVHRPLRQSARWDLGYLGTYSEDRQPPLERLMLEPARRAGGLRFVVAGPMYPDTIRWPGNCERIAHLPPDEHRRFYGGQRFTLNITRQAMVRAGWSPSVRLFEAAACGTPIISDEWDGLGTFFQVGPEILVTRSPADTLACLRDLPESERLEIARRARERILREHTSEQRARQLDGYLHAAARCVSHDLGVT